MTAEKKTALGKAVMILFALTFVAAIASNFYHFFYRKNYDYLVEASCDPASERCFYRDCETTPDDCPPNGLSYYKEYYVKGYDFKTCTDNSCAQECASGAIQCTPIECGTDSEDSCSDTPQE